MIPTITVTYMGMNISRVCDVKLNVSRLTALNYLETNRETIFTLRDLIRTSASPGALIYFNDNLNSVICNKH